MLKAWIRVATILAAVLHAAVASAQTSPTPGPTNPQPQPNPLAKPGSDMVINPTEEECKKGWTSGAKWTKEQFETFCTQLKTSK